MECSERLERLRSRLHAEVNALPDRETCSDPVHSSDDDDDSGGISLEPLNIQPPQIDQAPINDVVPLAEEINQEWKVTTNAEQRFIWLKGAESTFNPGNLPPKVKPPAQPDTLPTMNLQRGDLASSQDHFSPIQALAKFPYKFCNKSQMQIIASAFFDQGKFWEREWDLYYVWDSDPVKPLILVRESQVLILLREINDLLNLSLKITDQQREQCLITRFPNYPQFRPRYLGRSNSRAEHDDLVDKTPSADYIASGDPVYSSSDTSTLEHFNLLMEDLWSVQKANTKSSKAKKQQDRLAKQKSMADQLKRAQQYLGLRPSETNDGTLSPRLNAIDPLLPTPWPFDQSVVFVCVDVESYERAHSSITEIGVATLDTRDLIKLAPGTDGAGWRNQICAQHFRIKENRHLVNREFVHGCPDRFDFGSSTLVALKDAPSHIAACFHAPFGAINSAKAESIPWSDEARNIVLLGHDTASDIRYLQTIGYDPMKVENIIEVQDTAAVYRAWRLEQQTTNLGRILADFGIPGYNLHNAGNDAVYTLQALLAICVREATIRGEQI